jgi:hypothetical protein
LSTTSLALGGGGRAGGGCFSCGVRSGDDSASLYDVTTCVARLALHLLTGVEGRRTKDPHRHLHRHHHFVPS